MRGHLLVKKSQGKGHAMTRGTMIWREGKTAVAEGAWRARERNLDRHYGRTKAELEDSGSVTI
jgi:hypothetical protein